MQPESVPEGEVDPLAAQRGVKPSSTGVTRETPGGQDQRRRWAILGSFAFRGPRRLLYLFAFLSAMGGLIELLQTFSPGRTRELADAITNGAGAAAAAATGSTP